MRDSWLIIYPLVLVIEDCYVPESARLILEVVKYLDDETCAVTLKLRAMEAGWNPSLN